MTIIYILIAVMVLILVIGFSATGEGHITIIPMMYNSIGQGTWALLTDATQYTNSYWQNGTSADGDNISYKVYLDAGTYTMRFIWIRHTNRGIVDFYIDAAEVHSLDMNGATAVNQVDTKTGISIATAGLKTLKLQLDGTTSADYYCVYSTIALWRTA